MTAPHSKEQAMPDFDLVILYVDSPPASAAFYADLLGRQPLEASPTFAMFALPGGGKLGLWSRHTVEPAAAGAGGGGEIAFVVGDRAEIDVVHADWQGRGPAIAQA